MNWPNRITLFRVLLIPVIVVIYLITPLRETTVIFNHLTLANLIILGIALIGFLTDFLDGWLARKLNQITTMGKFLDALADKLMVTTLLIILCDQGIRADNNLMPWWVLVVVVARDMIVNGIRLVGASKNKVIAANIFGKIKSNVQYVTIIYLLLGIACNSVYYTYEFWYMIIGYVLVYLMVLVTIISGIIYVIQNRNILKEN